jgi:hypothetical protein
VDDVSVSLEHVDLLNSLDGLDIELLERRLQLLVIHPRALVYLLDLSPRRALSTVAGLSAFLYFAHFFPNPSVCRNHDRIRRARRRKT